MHLEAYICEDYIIQCMRLLYEFVVYQLITNIKVLDKEVTNGRFGYVLYTIMPKSHTFKTPP